MTYRAPTPPRPTKERDTRQVIRMPETPEEQERREKAERTAFILDESRRLDAALSVERRRFDGRLRQIGGVLLGIGIFLAAQGPLTTRGAAVSGMSLLVGLASAVLGGQGATRAENVPSWLKTTYAVAAVVGAALGLALLR